MHACLLDQSRPSGTFLFAWGNRFELLQICDSKRSRSACISLCSSPPSPEFLHTDRSKYALPDITEAITQVRRSVKWDSATYDEIRKRQATTGLCAAGRLRESRKQGGSRERQSKWSTSNPCNEPLIMPFGALHVDRL